MEILLWDTQNIGVKKAKHKKELTQFNERLNPEEGSKAENKFVIMFTLSS